MRAGPRARAVPAEIMIVRDAGVGATHTPPPASQHTPNCLHAQASYQFGHVLVCVRAHTHVTERSILTIWVSDTVPYTQFYEHCPCSLCLSISLFGDTSCRLPRPSEASDTHKCIHGHIHPTAFQSVCQGLTACQSDPITFQGQRMASCKNEQRVRDQSGEGSLS